MPSSTMLANQQLQEQYTGYAEALPAYEHGAGVAGWCRYIVQGPARALHVGQVYAALHEQYLLLLIQHLYSSVPCCPDPVY